MKFKVFDEKQNIDTVFFRLINDPDNEIKLIACDVTGKRLNQGTILIISSKGIKRMTDVSSQLGLPLDAIGRVNAD